MPATRCCTSGLVGKPAKEKKQKETWGRGRSADGGSSKMAVPIAKGLASVPVPWSMWTRTRKNMVVLSAKGLAKNAGGGSWKMVVPSATQCEGPCRCPEYVDSDEEERARCSEPSSGRISRRPFGGGSAEMRPGHIDWVCACARPQRSGARRRATESMVWACQFLFAIAPATSTG